MKIGIYGEEVINYLEAYYNNYDEEGRLLSRHGQVEYLTTMKYIQECIAEVSNPMILEVGAGTGRYSVTLAKQGFKVTAVELVEHNLEILRSKLCGEEPITAIQGNALDLSAFADNTFDLTMVLGPMYHLYTKKDKLQVLSEAVRVINLEVRSDNMSAIHLYEKYGYKKTGMIPAFFKIDKEYVDFDNMSLDLR